MSVCIGFEQKKGEYGFDHWADLTAKRRKEAGAKEDPMGGVMDLMKDMYESGDDNMRRVIGEAMVSPSAWKKQVQEPEMNATNSTGFLEQPSVCFQMKASRGERSPPTPGFSSSTEEFSA